MSHLKELSEGELEIVKDQLYKRSLQGESNFTGLLELIMMRENIIDAIRSIKSNGGFKTAGVDGVSGPELLAMGPEEVFKLIEKFLGHYNPKNVRRVMIPKRNGKLRPLSIPTIVDRIIQTAIVNIVNPILEAKMYEHSYGFRPLRSIEHAVAYMSALTTYNKRHFVVEGDIKSFFDEIDHNILLKKLHKYGITDKRVLAIIKKMLKAGVQGLKNVNEKGTPQGGTISTLLANVYLTDFDHWVDKQWRKFKTKHGYADTGKKNRALLSSNLKQGYLIRYADDWIILTDTGENAEKWKHACKKYLKKELKIELSEEKTKITNLTENHMDFLGFRFYKTKGKNGNWTLRSEPTPERIEEKVSKLRKLLTDIKKCSSQHEVIGKIFAYNSIVRGLRNFYKCATMINPVMSKYENTLWARQKSVMLKHGGTYVKVKECANLTYLHAKHGNQKTLAIQAEGLWIGIEKLHMVKFQVPQIKAQWITPYSVEGRNKYEEITGNRFSTLHRNPALTIGDISSLLAKNSEVNSIYTLEYFINRPMVFNRDKWQCKMCEAPLTGYGDTEIHHIDPSLQSEKLNKLPNLVTMCLKCHIEEHRERKRKKARIGRKSTTMSGDTKPSNTVKPSKKPSKEKLLELIKKFSYTAIGKEYEVSDNAVKKWAIGYGIHEHRIHKKPRGNH